jgi:hypothetical protein
MRIFETDLPDNVLLCLAQPRVLLDDDRELDPFLIELCDHILLRRLGFFEASYFSFRSGSLGFPSFLRSDS